MADLIESVTVSRKDQMDSIKIPVSICPHFSGGKPRGHYILAKRLFTKSQPIIAKQQYVGFNGFLFVTVVHPNQWDTTFKMVCAVLEMDQQPVKWLGSVHLYPLKGGFKAYLPESILQAREPGRIEDVGVFRKYVAPGFEIFYLEIPKLTAEVLLGRMELK